MTRRCVRGPLNPVIGSVGGVTEGPTRPRWPPPSNADSSTTRRRRNLRSGLDTRTLEPGENGCTTSSARDGRRSTAPAWGTPSMSDRTPPLAAYSHMSRQRRGRPEHARSLEPSRTGAGVCDEQPRSTGGETGAPERVWRWRGCSSTSGWSRGSRRGLRARGPRLFRRHTIRPGSRTTTPS